MPLGQSDSFEITELTERLEQLSVEAGRVSVALDKANAEIERLRAALYRIANLEDLTEADMVALEVLGSD